MGASAPLIAWPGADYSAASRHHLRSYSSMEAPCHTASSLHYRSAKWFENLLPFEGNDLAMRAFPAFVQEMMRGSPLLYERNYYFAMRASHSFVLAAVAVSAVPVTASACTAAAVATAVTSLPNFYWL